MHEFLTEAVSSSRPSRGDITLEKPNVPFGSGILVAILIACGFGAPPDTVPPNPANRGTYSIQQFARLQGIIVRDIRQDTQGRIWLATDSGVWRSEGDSFLPPPSVLHDIERAYCLYEDARHVMWIGTPTELVGVNIDTMRLVEEIDGRTLSHVLCFHEDPKGQAWIGTLFGLYRLDFANGRYHITPIEAMDRHQVYSIVSLPNGDMITCGDREIMRVRGNTVQAIHPDLVSDGVGRTMLQAKDGTFWLGLRNKGGLYQIRGNNIYKMGPADGLFCDEVNVLIQHPEGNIYIGTEEGVYRWDGTSLAHIGFNNGLANQDIHALSVDREGQLWIGSYGGGALLLRSPYVVSFGPEQGLHHPVVMRAVTQPNGRILLGSITGLSSYDPETATIRHVEHGSLLHVNALFVDRKGNAWAGGPQGFAKLGENRLLAKPIDVRTLGEDAQGNLLIGAYLGLWRLRGEAVEWVSLPLDSQPIINDIVITSKDVVYVATNLGLVRQMTPDGEWQRVGPTRDTTALHANENGELDVATSEGLFRLTGDEFVLQHETGTPIYYVRSLDRSPDGTLWAATNNGILRIEENSTKRFGSLAGLPSEDVRAVIAPRDDTIYIGTTRGFSRIASAHLKACTAPPLIMATIMAGAQTWDASKTNQIAPPGANDFTLHIQPLGSQSVEGLQYQYQLMGRDAEWLPLTHNPTITFHDLDPGDYTIRARAINRHGLWSNEIVAPITAVAPIWRRSWFLALAGAAALCVAYLAINLLIKHSQLATERKRVEAVTARQRALEALAVSEERYRSLVENIPAVTWTADSRGKITYVSPSVEEAYGFTPEEIYANPVSTFYDRVHQDDAERVNAAYAAFWDANAPFDIEYRIRHKNGEWVWIQDRAIRTHQLNGRRYTDGVLTVITSRKLAEDALRSSHDELERRVHERTAALASANATLQAEILERTRAEQEAQNLRLQIEFVLGATNTGLDIIDADHNIHYVDPKWRELRGDPAGRKCYEYFVGETKPCPGCMVSEAIHNRQTTVVQRGITPIRSYPIQITTIPFESESGEWLGAQVKVDITEQKRHEEALRESTQRLSGIVGAIAGNITMLDEDLNIVWANEVATRWFGDNIVGRKCYEVYHHRPTPCAACLVKDTFADGKVHQHETPVIDANNRTRHFLCTSDVAEFDANGHPKLVVEVSMDISDRKKAEEELRTFKTISDVTSHGHAIFDMDQQLVYVNTAFAHMHGYEPAELIGKPISTFHTEEQMPEVQQVLSELFSGTPKAGVEVWHKHHDGKTFPTLMDVVIIQDEHGQSKFISGMAVDISDQKVTEAAIRRQALVFKNMNDGIIITNADRQITDWNPAAERIFGYTREEMLGQTPEMLNRPEDAEFVTQSIHEKLPVKGYWSDELSVVRKDGTERVCEVFVVPLLTEDGQWTTTVSFNRDITERRKAEEERLALEGQLQQSQKMEAIGTLASGIAHEFKNLLTAIAGYSRTARDALQEGHPAHPSLEMVDRAAIQAKHVTDMLLTYGQKSSGHGADQNGRMKSVFNLADCLDEHLDLLRRMLPASIQLHVNIDRHQDLYIKGDPIQLQQAVMNLAINAEQSIDEEGQITITVGHASSPPSLQHDAGRDIESDLPFGVAIITVTDTGHGMTPEIQARAFDPFFTTKPRHQGSGLGLAVTHGIIRNHGGAIHVESQVHEGTTMSLWLPCVSRFDAIPQTPSRSSQRVHGSGQRILLVEPNEHVKSVITTTLRGYHYVVRSAIDQDSLLEAVKEDTPDIVVFDLDGNEDTALASLGQLRANDQDVRILVLTGDLDLRPVDYGLSAEQILRKPFRMLDLTSQIAVVLGITQPTDGMDE